MIFAKINKVPAKINKVPAKINKVKTLLMAKINKINKEKNFVDNFVDVKPVGNIWEMPKINKVNKENPWEAEIENQRESEKNKYSLIA